MSGFYKVRGRRRIHRIRQIDHAELVFNALVFVRLNYVLPGFQNKNRQAQPLIHTLSLRTQKFFLSGIFLLHAIQTDILMTFPLSENLFRSLELMLTRYFNFEQFNYNYL